MTRQHDRSSGQRRARDGRTIHVQRLARSQYDGVEGRAERAALEQMLLRYTHKCFLTGPLGTFLRDA